MHARARTEIEDVIRRPNRVRVVLDHDHGVAEIAQALERVEQPIVVALVQADARLIQNVKHAHQPRADLRRQPDALRLAAAQRAALAIQREIAQPDVLQEARAARGSP